MSTVWTFGDSFTDGFRSNDLWAKRYVGWKGYQPKTYGEIIAENLGFEIINLGKGGSDNYTIFETFCESIGKIKKNDIVIIGWSSPLRFRVVDDFGKWKSILPDMTSNCDSVQNISTNTINELIVNRDHFLYSVEVNHWIMIINSLLKDNVILHWTAFNTHMDAIFIRGIERITIETNGELIDGHFSEKGHLELSQILMSKFTKNKKIL